MILSYGIVYSTLSGRDLLAFHLGKFEGANIYISKRASINKPNGEEVFADRRVVLKSTGWVVKNQET